MDLVVNQDSRMCGPPPANFRCVQERYVVRGGALIVLPALAGDEVSIVDPEGLQCCHVAAFDSKGKCCTGQFSAFTPCNSSALAGMLAKASADARGIRSKFKVHNIDLPKAECAAFLDGQTPANSSVVLHCQVDCILVIGAPGEDMHVDGHNPPTDLIVHVNRNSPNAANSHSLSDPIADPLQDFTVKAATATSYEVKAGQYIQVLDIEGKQCSDFQSFDIHQLNNGVERCLDATATRTMVGAAYPRPGLASKFFDVDMEPLIEVLQDTCGRHDSFGFACTAKYYDEAGYPGHVNCSDNFNFALHEYPIVPRKGWMAINLFFNTFFDDHFQLYLDEPWSRPGDFILMRALRDMVCVSSSCPDDIDAANAWNPTDIQVRVYDQKEIFKKSIAFRKTPEAEPKMTSETGFHPETSKLTRDFVEYEGYWLANSYTNLGAIAEYWACRQAAAVIDLSPLRKYEVVGPDSELLLQTCVTRDVKKISVGQVTYTAMCNESGGMIDDGTVFRLSKENFRWVGGSDNSGLWLRQQAQERGLKAWVKSSTEELSNIQVQGPKSRDVLKQLVWTRADQASIEELGWFRFSIARMLDSSGIPIVVSRTGYTGELGYEIFCHPKDAAEVWRIIQDQDVCDVKPMGLEALDLLRVEAGLIFAGYEFCEQTDPFEAGIGFTVPLQSKPDDFIGREALNKRKAAPQRKLVGLELTGREVAVHGDGAYIGRQKVGEVTSSTISPVLGKTIALCRMNIEYCGDGTEVEIGKLDQHQKRIPAVVVPFPHFDPNKSRVRGHYSDTAVTS